MEHPNGHIGTLYLSNQKAQQIDGCVVKKGSRSSPTHRELDAAYCLNKEFEREQKVGGGYYRFHIQMP